MTAPLTYDIAAASKRLGEQTFTVDFLKKHLHEIPHGKTGRGTGRAGRIYFTEAHLAEILLKFEQRPTDSPAPNPDDWGIVSRGSRRAS